MRSTKNSSHTPHQTKSYIHTYVVRVQKQKKMNFILRTSYIAHHTSYLIPRTTYFVHHTLHIILRTSYLAHHTLHFILNRYTFRKFK